MKKKMKAGSPSNWPLLARSLSTEAQHIESSQKEIVFFYNGNFSTIFSVFRKQRRRKQRKKQKQKKDKHNSVSNHNHNRNSTPTRSNMLQHNNNTTTQQQHSTTTQQPHSNHTTTTQQPRNNNTIWGGSVSTGEEPPLHIRELKHALIQARGPTPFQLSRPMSLRHHITMEHRLPFVEPCKRHVHIKRKMVFFAEML